MSRKLKATKKHSFTTEKPSSAEREAIERAQTRVGGRSPRLRVEFSQNKNGAIELFGGNHSDHEGWLARLQDAFGSRGTDFALCQVNRLMAVCRQTDGKIDKVRVNSLLAMIEGATPQNEVQAALAVQIALTHAAAQTVLERALRVDQIPQFDSASTAVVKLLRTFTLQVEALAKLQRGGEQIVKVVHVHPGAQAIVGNVMQSPDQGGGGAIDENSKQPHAKAELPAHSTPLLPQVWCENQERQPLPLTDCDRQKALPDARRRAR